MVIPQSLITIQFMITSFLTDEAFIPRLLNLSVIV